MRALVEDFITYVVGERNFSQHTARAYRADLLQFERFLEGELGRPPGLPDLNRIHVRLFAGWLMQEGRKQRTIVRKLASIRSFQAFLRRHGMLDEQDWGRLAPRQQQQTLPAVLDVNQVGKVMTLPPNNTPAGVRDRAMLELLYSSGLRVSELVGLDVTRLDIVEGLVRVHGKGAKERIVPVGRMAVEALDRYMRYFRWQLIPASVPRRRQVARKEPALFLSKLGRRISVERVRGIVTGYLRQVSTAESLGPHLLRHACATHLIEQGAGLRDVQELLGHESVNSTQIYVSVAATRLTSVYAKAHPRAS